MSTDVRPFRVSKTRPRMTVGSWLVTIALSVGCLVVLLPVVWMVLTSLKAPDQVFRMPPLGKEEASGSC